MHAAGGGVGGGGGVEEAVNVNATDIKHLP